MTITHPEKVFWPKEGYTKADLVDYYRKIAHWMLPYLKDRPVMIVRYPDGIEGKSFYQKDAPAFAPEWIRTVTIYSHDSQRDINYFIVENEDALAYLANLATIPIHIWSSRIGSVENPDWLLFDLDPKGSTTEKAVHTARETVKLLSEIGLKAAIKTSGQMGIHVMAGLKPDYTYQQARDFAEIVAQTGGGEDPGPVHHRAQQGGAGRQGLYRLPPARPRQNDRGALHGTAESRRAGLVTDALRGTETRSRSRKLHHQEHGRAHAKLKTDPSSAQSRISSASSLR